MAITVAADEHITLGTPDVDHASAMRWLSPILIGLSAPAILAFLFLQDNMMQIRTLVFLIMMIALIISIFAYVATVLVPGDPSGLNIFASRREVEVILVGPFAATIRRVPFDDIASLRTSVRYDDDGYSETVAELTTLDGDVYSIPMSQPLSDFQAARLAMGLTSRR
jgi:hypothetical protein